MGLFTSEGSSGEQQHSDPLAYVENALDYIFPSLSTEQKNAVASRKSPSSGNKKVSPAKTDRKPRKRKESGRKVREVVDWTTPSFFAEEPRVKRDPSMLDMMLNAEYGSDKENDEPYHAQFVHRYKKRQAEKRRARREEQRRNDEEEKRERDEAEKRRCDERQIQRSYSGEMEVIELTASPSTISSLAAESTTHGRKVARPKKPPVLTEREKIRAARKLLGEIGLSGADSVQTTSTISTFQTRNSGVGRKRSSVSWNDNPVNSRTQRNSPRTKPRFGVGASAIKAAKRALRRVKHDTTTSTKEQPSSPSSLEASSSRRGSRRASALKEPETAAIGTPSSTSRRKTPTTTRPKEGEDFLMVYPQMASGAADRSTIPSKLPGKSTSTRMKTRAAIAESRVRSSEDIDIDSLIHAMKRTDSDITGRNARPSMAASALHLAQTSPERMKKMVGGMSFKRNNDGADCTKTLSKEVEQSDHPSLTAGRSRRLRTPFSSLNGRKLRGDNIGKHALGDVVENSPDVEVEVEYIDPSKNGWESKQVSNGIQKRLQRGSITDADYDGYEDAPFLPVDSDEGYSSPSREYLKKKDLAALADDTTTPSSSCGTSSAATSPAASNSDPIFGANLSAVKKSFTSMFSAGRAAECLPVMTFTSAAGDGSTECLLRPPNTSPTKKQSPARWSPKRLLK